MLHVTNGESAAYTIRATDIGGDVLSWRDAIHEGPVPAGLSLAELSRVRASYIAGEGWCDEHRVQREFAERDESLLASGANAEIVLWFEHDLYDQLQLIQVLSILAELEIDQARCSLISIDQFPGIESFHGLGELNIVQIASLFPQRVTIFGGQLDAAVDAWNAFRAPDPTALTIITASSNSLLPFLPRAIDRFLQDYPSVQNGLGRTEQQALEAIRDGCRTFESIFKTTQSKERSPFLGDSILWSRLLKLIDVNTPLLACTHGDEPLVARNAIFTLTPAGEAVLEETSDHILLNGIDRWFGGVHMASALPQWRRKTDHNTIVAIG